MRRVTSRARSRRHVRTLCASLSCLARRPFRLGAIARKRLGHLPFLSSLRVERLLRCHSHCKGVLALCRLGGIRTFSLRAVSLLIPFVCVDRVVISGHPVAIGGLLGQNSGGLRVECSEYFRRGGNCYSCPSDMLRRCPGQGCLKRPFCRSIHCSCRFSRHVRFNLIARGSTKRPF